MEASASEEAADGQNGGQHQQAEGQEEALPVQNTPDSSRVVADTVQRG